jgi:prepilin-type N-terminal cleavage/methylation domain-containing protein
VTERLSAGFTLAEVLIALALLGVVATFSIPKIMQAQTNNHYNAVAKEAMATVRTSFMLLKEQGRLVPGVTKMSDIMKESLNATQEVGTQFDHQQNSVITVLSCSGLTTCYRLATGAIISTATDHYYQPETHDPVDNEAVHFLVDPDGRLTSSGDPLGPGKSLPVVIYPNGLMRTKDNLLPNSTLYYVNNTTQTFNSAPQNMPNWFQW